MSSTHATPARLAALARQRRVILQYDAINVIEENGTARLRDEDDFALYLARVFDAIDHVQNPIDSVFWDIMYAGDEYALYPSAFLPRRRTGRFGKWADQGHDVFQALLDGGIARGLENILVHRISETDIDPQTHPNLHKQAHPEMYIKSWLWSGLHNLAVPEIRERKLRVLTECLQCYAFDGLQIDYCRHTPFLPPGSQWALREHATEFMRMLRAALDALEATDGKARLLCARVSETLECCRADGLDIEAWAAEGLVDCLTLGDRNFAVDLPGFRSALAGTPIRLYPCEDAHHCVDGYADPPIEVHRGVFSSWWDQGADGIALFNWYAARREVYQATGKGAFTLTEHCDCQMATLAELAVPERMPFLDKTFVVERKGGYPWEEGYANNNRNKPLPMPLPNDGRSAAISLYCPDRISDFPGRVRELRLELVAYGMGDSDELEACVNGFPVDGAYDRAWQDKQIQAPGPELVSGYHIKDLPERPDQRLTKWTCALMPGSLIKGQNAVSVRLRRNGRYPYCAVVTLERVEIHVQYQNVKG